MSDNISREKLQTQLNCVDRLQMTIDGRAIEVIPRWNVNKIIENLPFAERKGKWIHPYKSDVACECSACHMQMPITDWFHFCPNCGAHMEGEEE